MALRYLDRSADAATVASILRRDGAVVVTELIEPQLADTVAAELRPQLDAEGLRPRSSFNGDLTRRYGGVMSTAPSAAELVDHDSVIGVANEILLPHASTYRISSLTAIEIMPGETAQALHRDDTVYPINLAGMELVMGVMWSLCDFTPDNGATRLIPGSHRFMRSWHLPEVSRWEASIMAKGSALFYLGSMWHGGGANQSDMSRLGLINSYCLGWLRPEVNQYLMTPPDIAVRYGPRLRALLGYMPHGSGDDLCGGFRGECAAWVDTPPESAWRGARGQIATVADAKTQSGA